MRPPQAGPLPGDAPATPEADEARRAAEAELSRAVYADSPNILERIWRWIEERLAGASLDVEAPSWLSLLIAALLLAAIIALLILLLRRVTLPRRGAPQDPAMFDDERDSTELSRSADAAADQGDFATALIERFRSIIRSLDEKGIIEEYPGMTAAESVALASWALGGQEIVSRLGQAAELFDAVRYGRVASTREQDEWMRGLARDVHQVEPAPQALPATVGAAP